MPKKLLEAPLPASDKPGVIIETQLPLGSTVLKFGFQQERSAIQRPGPNGQPMNTVTLKPTILALGDPTEQRLETHRFQMVFGSEDIPDDAHYVDLVTLPTGAVIHLFELGEPVPVVALVSG